jgi:hypothetical protein
MLRRAINTRDDPELEGSEVLNKAIERVLRCNGESEAVARVIPILDSRDRNRSLRARFCLLKLNATSPELNCTLIEMYRNVNAPQHDRMEAACLLLRLAPNEAEVCGAAESARRWMENVRYKAPVPVDNQLEQEPPGLNCPL